MFKQKKNNLFAYIVLMTLALLCAVTFLHGKGYEVGNEVKFVTDDINKETSTLDTFHLDNKNPTAVKPPITTIKLSLDNTVALVGEISQNAGSVAQEIIKKGSGKDPVYLAINSPGGSVLDGAMIVSAIQSSKAPVYTICIRICASMAAIIHQYGTQRLALDRSVLMFHDAAGGTQGYLPHMKSQLLMLDLYISKMNAYIAARAGLEKQAFVNRVHENIWLDGEEAYTQKFVDKLVYVSFDSTLTRDPVTEKLFSPKFAPEKALGLDFKNDAK